jgi:hypothetical protein
VPSEPGPRGLAQWRHDISRHFWEHGPAAIAGAVLGAIVGAVVGALMTALIGHATASSAPKPTPTVTTTAMMTTTVTATATVSATVTVTPSPAAPGGGTSSSPEPGVSPNSFSVPFADFCAMQQSAVSADCHPGSVYVGPNLWGYAAFNGGAVSPRWTAIITVPANSCSRLVLYFAVDSEHSEQGAIARVKVSEEGYKSYTNAVAFGKVGTLPVPLHGQSFGIEISSTDGSNVYIQGSATCATEDGVA